MMTLPHFLSLKLIALTNNLKYLFIENQLLVVHLRTFQFQMLLRTFHNTFIYGNYVIQFKAKIKKLLLKIHCDNVILKIFLSRQTVFHLFSDLKMLFLKNLTHHINFYAVTAILLTIAKLSKAEQN